MSRSVLCFGDSNTYGYDPRSCLGGRYPSHVRWTGLLGARTGWEVLERGENGREIPRRDGSPAPADALPDPWPPLDALVVLLGSNDLLQGRSAEETGARMEAFLCRILAPSAAPGPAGVLLIAPPPLVWGDWVTDGRQIAESARLGACYGALARRLGVGFADAGTWNIPLAFDGVHFTPEGHRAFALGAVETLRALFAGRGEGPCSSD